MPQTQFMFFAPAEPAKKHSPILKLSSGIGDTDGFPAFDSESDNYAAVDDPKWGFRITGGAEFHMPITVFQVSADGLASKEGIELGDIILEVNEIDTTNLTLAQTQELINSAGKKLHLVARSMEEIDAKGKLIESVDKFVTLRVPKPGPPPKVNIKERLRELQQKLSEIAEIPKILSTTLETVSQTFDKFLPPEPENDEINENKEEFDKNEHTTASSYSEESDQEDDDDQQVEYEYDYHSYEDEDEDEDEIEEYDDGSFRKWSNLNIPESIIEEEIEEIETPSEPTEEELIKKDKQEKIEKLERSWPWADRHKVIYKQSSCHMVPRKPLGIVENRIKQLVQRNLDGIIENKHQI